MQSLTNMSFKTIIKKQVKWKAKLYSSALSSLIILQIIFGALLFSSGSGSSGHGRGNLNVQFSIYSLDTFLFITVFWAFITAILFTTKAYRMDDLSIISSRTSSAIANILVLILYSFIAVLIMLASYYIQILGLMLMEKETFIIDKLLISPSIFILCICSICLFSAIGLLFGYCFQGPSIIKIASIVLLATGIISPIIFPESVNLQPFIQLPDLMLSGFYIILSILCFTLCIWIADKSEVSRK